MDCSDWVALQDTGKNPEGLFKAYYGLFFQGGGIKGEERDRSS